MKKAMTEQQTMIETNVGSLAVRERGEGRPAVLWHSLFMDERSWERVDGVARSVEGTSKPAARREKLSPFPLRRGLESGLE